MITKRRLDGQSPVFKRALNSRQLSLPQGMERKCISSKYKKKGFLHVDGLVTCGRMELLFPNYLALKSHKASQDPGDPFRCTPRSQHELKLEFGPYFSDFAHAFLIVADLGRGPSVLLGLAP